MKKVLFATSALVASAGFAAADVSLSGSAEMGIRGGSNQETRFHTHADVAFALSGSTDNGLTFGVAGVALTDADNLNADGGEDNGMSVFISGNFGTLTMGDTDGAYDWGMSEVPTGSGSIADNETAHSGWNGNGGLDSTHDNQVLRYDHSVGGLGFAVSIELDDTAGATEGDSIIGLGLRYSLGDLNIGLGYQTGEDTGAAPRNDLTIMGISLGYTMGDLSLGANYSVLEETGAADTTHVALGMSYSMDAITVGVNWGETDDGAGADSGWGFSAGYDLGGGASILLGYGNDSPSGAASTSSWSLGVSMSF